MKGAAVLPGVERALRDLTARRLARAYLGLAALAALSIGDWMLTGMSSALAFWSAAGVPLSAAALLAVGWRGVRRGGGAPWAPWMTGVAAVGAFPWLHGVFVLTGPGLRRVAVEGFGAGTLAVGGAYALLGIRLLRDALRVGEVGRLGAAMAVPASEESGG
ncbi:MAG TPA: hypothetical protein VLA43_13215 [Longimicrobiales bacterium]|nr:hypothetical protein [Longimicrobiales bacterium]